MDIFKDKVLIVSWQSKPTGILITSSEIADHFKRNFDSLWGYSTILRVISHGSVEIEYDKPETITEALKGIDSLFLLTPTHPRMIEFTTNLINGAIERGVKHIVKLSHIRADPADEPQINITRLHRQAEKIIEESGIPG